MKGEHRIVVENHRVKYELSVKRNITIIRGDSATGKTELLRLIDEYDRDRVSSGVTIHCDKKCRVLTGSDWNIRLNGIKDSIVFVDEENRFIHSKEFAEAVRFSDNYYVLITRDDISTLPYSAMEIYGLKESGKYVNAKKVYNEMFRLYGDYSRSQKVSPGSVLTEDSAAGFQFFKSLCDENGILCVSAEGKSQIYNKLKTGDYSECLIVADGAAFGSEMDLVMKYLKEHSGSVLYLPESFEWLILKSGVLRDSEVEKILESPEEYIESSEYFSWERYFTALLIEKTKDTYLSYSKKELNEVYLREEIQEQILNVMENIRFEKK